MALLESVAASYGLGAVVGYAGTRVIAPAAGIVLRPVAKTLIKGALVVGDGVGSIFNGSPPKPRGREDTITVKVKAAPKKRRASRSQGRPASSSRQKRPRQRRASGSR